jgi:hypothetical protein
MAHCSTYELPQAPPDAYQLVSGPAFVCLMYGLTPDESRLVAFHLLQMAHAQGQLVRTTEALRRQGVPGRIACDLSQAVLRAHGITPGSRDDPYAGVLPIAAGCFAGESRAS